MSLVQLVSGRNGEGYLHALSRTWDIQDDLENMPVKSALAKKRERVSFELFKETFDSSIEAFEPCRRTWRGLHVYATDGDQHELPASNAIFSEGYKGYPCADDRETYYPRMYVVHCYDVLSNVTKAFRYSSKNNEVAHATEIAGSLEKSSLTIYDRLYMSADLFRAHAVQGSFALIRCRNGGFKEVTEFFESAKRNSSFEIDGITIYLVKVVNPKTKDVSVFATNLPRDRFTNKELSDLYALRWEAETANRDLTSTMKLEQWHSLSINGILQEIYVALWLMNQARIQMALRMTRTCSLKALFDYEKSNFKLVLDFLLDSLRDLVRGRTARVKNRLKQLLKISIEKRKRRSRSYPRQLRSGRKNYPLASTVARVTK